MPKEAERPGERDRRNARPDYEIAYYTKELGRPLQRKLLQQQFDTDFKDSQISAAHGDDAQGGAPHTPPPEDRAG